LKPERNGPFEREEILLKCVFEMQCVLTCTVYIGSEYEPVVGCREYDATYIIPPS